MRELARQAYGHPDGSSWTYSRGTLDRWVRAYREGGLDGLRPPPRADLGVVRRHPELLKEACQLRLELPGRSAVQIGAIVKPRYCIHLPEWTIREHLHRRRLHRAALAGQPRAFGRFEAERPNERWIGDARHASGPPSLDDARPSPADPSGVNHTKARGVDCASSASGPLS